MSTFIGKSSKRIVIDLRSVDSISKTQKEIRARLAVANLSGFFTRKMLRDLARKLEVFYIKPMMIELRTPPPRRMYPEDYPVEFVSDKQRRYVMWLLDGKPHQRTNKLVHAWGYKTRLKNNKSISFEVENSRPEAKYVVGLIGMGRSQRSIKRYSGKIQPFHKRTGWQPAYEIVQRYIDDAQEDAVETVKKWIKRGQV